MRFSGLGTAFAALNLCVAAFADHHGHLDGKQLHRRKVCPAKHRASVSAHGGWPDSSGSKSYATPSPSGWTVSSSWSTSNVPTTSPALTPSTMTSPTTTSSPSSTTSTPPQFNIQVSQAATPINSTTKRSLKRQDTAPQFIGFSSDGHAIPVSSSQAALFYLDTAGAIILGNQQLIVYSGLYALSLASSPPAEAKSHWLLQNGVLSLQSTSGFCLDNGKEIDIKDNNPTCVVSVELQVKYPSPAPSSSTESTSAVSTTSTTTSGAATPSASLLANCPTTTTSLTDTRDIPWTVCPASVFSGDDSNTFIFNVGGVSSFDACMQRCNGYQECAGVSWSQSSNFCVGIAHIGTAAPSINSRTDFSSAVRLRKPDVACPGAVGAGTSTLNRVRYNFCNSGIWQTASLNTSRQTTLDRCLRECEGDGDCTGISYQTSTNTCVLRTGQMIAVSFDPSWISAEATSAKPNPPCGQPTTRDVESLTGGRYTTCENGNWIGTTLLNSSNVASLALCLSLCDGRQECVGASYTSATRVCVLSSGELTRIALQDGTTTGFITQRPTPEQLCQSRSTFTSDAGQTYMQCQNGNWQGGVERAANTFNRCAQWCDGDPSCTGISFSNQLNRCWTLTSPNATAVQFDNTFQYAVAQTKSNPACPLQLSTVTNSNGISYSFCQGDPLPRVGPSSETRVGTSFECTQQCDGDPTCQSLMWSNVNGRCLLFSSASTVAVVAPNPEWRTLLPRSKPAMFCPVQPLTSSQSLANVPYTMCANAQWRGGRVLRTGRSESIQTCQRSCDQLAACLSFHYTNSGSCVLEAGSPTSAFLDTTVRTAGRIDPSNKPRIPCPGPVTSDESWDTCAGGDWFGQDHPVSGVGGIPNIPTVALCQGVCSSTDGCTGVAYSTNQRRCWMKTGQPLETLVNADITSSFRR